jgi:predicted lactoylglutathione lyase
VEREREKKMSLQLYMIGLAVQDMDKSQEFYRRLGLDIPEKQSGERPLFIKMEGKFSLFLALR